MKTQNPAPAEAGHGARFQSADTRNLVPLSENFNNTDRTLRARLLDLGRQLHHRGERPVAEFCAELSDLPEVYELIARLEDFCRMSPATYAAVGADRFTPFLVGIPGGRRGRGAA